MAGEKLQLPVAIPVNCGIAIRGPVVLRIRCSLRPGERSKSSKPDEKQLSTGSDWSLFVRRLRAAGKIVAPGRFYVPIVDGSGRASCGPVPG
jgi:hypothetical protein